MVFGLPLVTQLLIVAHQSQNRDVSPSTLRRGNLAQLGTGVGCPSMCIALGTLLCSEHPGDSPASWRRTRSGAEAIVHGRGGKLWEIGTVGAIVGAEIRSDVGPRL